MIYIHIYIFFVHRFNIEKRRRQYLADIFTTLIDLKWRYALCLFTLGFCLSWLAFALIWYLLMFIYGDLQPENYHSTNYTACIAGVHSFAGAILFSIETQQTIGYGTRVVKETCYFAIVIMMFQSSIGVLLQSFMVGVVFAKISRPKKRTETLIWSREAVICLRDGQMTLQCRVGDMRKSHIVEAHVRMYLIKKRVTLEGEILPLHTYDMNVGFDKGVDRLFLIWPLVIEHIIDEQSPLYDVFHSIIQPTEFSFVVIVAVIIIIITVVFSDLHICLVRGKKKTRKREIEATTYKTVRLTSSTTITTTTAIGLYQSVIRHEYFSA